MKGWVGATGFYPARLCLFLQGLDAAAIGAQVGHQGLMLLKQSLWKKTYEQKDFASNRMWQKTGVETKIQYSW